MKRYVYRFAVEGVFGFPVDMLRYDHCYPASENDSYLIEKMVGSGSRRAERINLITVRFTKDWQPTAGRWASFGWKVDIDDMEVGS